MSTMDSTSAPAQEAHSAHGTTITAAALAARVAALEAQLEAAQRANAALISQIVALEYERDAARAGEARALAAAYTEIVSRFAALSEGLNAVHAPALSAAPGRCNYCGLPLVSAHIADEVILANGTRRVTVHGGCAAAYLRLGWHVVAQARGGAASQEESGG